MAKIFYDHLIYIEEVIAELDVHDLSPMERTELLQLIDETLHNHILDVILSELPHEHHEVFLAKFTSSPHDPELLTFIKEKGNKNIEKLITSRAKSVKKKLVEEIKKARK